LKPFLFWAPLKTPARRHSGSFAAYLRCENLEIHKVFLQFSPSICGKISRCASRPGFLEVPFCLVKREMVSNFRRENRLAAGFMKSGGLFLMHGTLFSSAELTVQRAALRRHDLSS